jgi:glyoxalase family protein
MAYPILGLHHVTATVDEAQADLDFFAGILGLRLLKKTVNFDNHHVFHFYYGNESGTPGTIWTTFPYRGHGVAVGTKGAGQIGVTSFSVPAGSLGFWKSRLYEAGTDVREQQPRFGEESIVVADPSGLAIELIATGRDSREPWSASVPSQSGVRGLHSVSLLVRSPAQTLELLTELLGFQVVNETAGRTRVAIGRDEPGKILDIVEDHTLPPAINGLGTVHHVALAIDGEHEQLLLREELVRRGYKVTQVLDRQYFRSIYFREPGGVLLEVATITPGFTVDEPLADLGTALKLPPWEEPNRTAIEAGLPVVTFNAPESR